MQSRVQIGSQLVEITVRRCGLSADDQRHGATDPGQPLGHQGPKATFDPVAGRRIPYRAADDEADSRWTRVVAAVGVHDDRPSGCPLATPYDEGELGGPAQTVGTRKHCRVRRRAANGPCVGAHRRWHGRPGSASAGENRGSCADAGCSAGTFAWSRLGTPLRCGHAAASDCKPPAHGTRNGERRSNSALRCDRCSPTEQFRPSSARTPPDTPTVARAVARQHSPLVDDGLICIPASC